jgi:hypothetical protein
MDEQDQAWIQKVMAEERMRMDIRRQLEAEHRTETEKLDHQLSWCQKRWRKTKMFFNSQFGLAFFGSVVVAGMTQVIKLQYERYQRGRQVDRAFLEVAYRANRAAEIARSTPQPPLTEVLEALGPPSTNSSQLIVAFPEYKGRSMESLLLEIDMEGRRSDSLTAQKLTELRKSAQTNTVPAVTNQLERMLKLCKDRS